MTRLTDDQALSVYCDTMEARLTKLEDALKEIVEFSKMPQARTPSAVGLVTTLAGQLGTVNGIALRALEKS